MVFLGYCFDQVNGRHCYFNFQIAILIYFVVWFSKKKKVIKTARFFFLNMIILHFSVKHGYMRV